MEKTARKKINMTENAECRIKKANGQNNKRSYKSYKKSRKGEAMKKIVYLNTAIGSENFGDYIINESIGNEMHYLNKDAFVYELPTHTKTFGMMQKVFARHAIRAFNNVDYKFLNGTNALYTCMIRPNPNWKISVFDHPCAKDVILLGVGLGVNRKKSDPYTKALWRKVLSKEMLHSVRDRATEEYLDDLGFKALYTGCPTTWQFTENFLEDVPVEKSEAAVIMLTGYLPNKAFDSVMVDAVCDAYDEVYFVPQQYGDIKYLKELGTESQLKKITYVGGNISAYNELLTKKKVDYIGNRLHGGMYALQHKRKSIVFSIDYRAGNMLKDANFCFPRNEETQRIISDLIYERICPKLDLPTESIKQWKSQFK